MDEKEYLKKGLKNFAKEVKQDMEISGLILFGSRATDTFSENSDVDLIIVSSEFEKMNFFERVKKMYSYWKIDLPVDFICYTPKEFNKLKKTISIVTEAIAGGIELKNE